jgi:peptide chain release factor 2
VLVSQQVIDVEALKARISELEAKTLHSGFWDAPDEAQKIMSEMTAYKDDVAMCEEWDSLLADADVALELAASEEVRFNFSQYQGRCMLHPKF